MCKYNQDICFEVDVSIDWLLGIDIKENMEVKCVKKMIIIIDSKLFSMFVGQEIIDRLLQVVMVMILRIFLI